MPNARVVTEPLLRLARDNLDKVWAFAPSRPITSSCVSAIDPRILSRLISLGGNSWRRRPAIAGAARL